MTVTRLPWRWERQAALVGVDNHFHPQPMQPFFVGAAPRRLFAIFQAAAAPGTAGPAVLICGPHGQEAVRAHRLLRVLADRLARSGCDVLRFDPCGSGDSAGADEELDWPGWIADLQLAAHELARRSPDRAQVWFGARLGATAACIAAAHDPAQPSQAVPRPVAARPAALVLCEPVLDGGGYLRSMALATVQALEASCSIKDPAWRRILRDDPAMLEREAVGFALGEDLHRALRGLRPESVACPAVGRVAAVVPQDDPLLADAASRWRRAGCAVSVETVPYRFDWTAEEALNTAIVPHELVQRICSLVVPGAAQAQPA